LAHVKAHSPLYAASVFPAFPWLMDSSRLALSLGFAANLLIVALVCLPNVICGDFPP
jgi:hypothetical protein